MNEIALELKTKDLQSEESNKADIRTSTLLNDTISNYSKCLEELRTVEDGLDRITQHLKLLMLTKTVSFKIDFKKDGKNYEQV